MDTLSHGLWGGALFGGKERRTFWAGFGWGVAPDLFSFGPIFVTWALRGFPQRRGPGEPPDPASVPAYVSSLYDVTHSLVVFAAAFLLVWLVMRWSTKEPVAPPWPMLAWAFHILLDVPTHKLAFFPTPYLWPFPTPLINGVHWTTPWVLALNWGLLLAALSARRKRKTSLL